MIVPYGIVGFIFPGARCPCGSEMVCGKDKGSAERNFYGMFETPFASFLADPDSKEIIDDTSRKKELKALRVAREEDYYLLNK